jgi:hypothetical protein
MQKGGIMIKHRHIGSYKTRKGVIKKRPIHPLRRISKAAKKYLLMEGKRPSFKFDVNYDKKVVKEVDYPRTHRGHAEWRLIKKYDDKDKALQEFEKITPNKEQDPDGQATFLRSGYYPANALVQIDDEETLWSDVKEARNILNEADSARRSRLSEKLRKERLGDETIFAENPNFIIPVKGFEELGATTSKYGLGSLGRYETNYERSRPERTKIIRLKNIYKLPKNFNLETKKVETYD